MGSAGYCNAEEEAPTHANQILCVAERENKNIVSDVRVMEEDHAM